ncbi:MAG: F0F1 ATP synthase subunit A [Planctomycetota bacterium]|nr:F0F1 ATP synthase subunit A [Planctomycetota bacterium]
MAEGHEEDVFHHVRDFTHFDLPFGEKLELPQNVFGTGFDLTKFMVLQVVAGLLTFLIFRGLAKRVQGGQPVRGRFWNFWESIAIFIRDEVVRPTIGDSSHGHGDDDHGDSHGHDSHGHSKAAAQTYSHPADVHLPFIWTCFFYVLFCNLLGAIPMLGSATGEINVTGALALIVFATVIIVGSRASGVGGFWLSLSPPLEGPLKVMHIILWPIELFGLLVKHGVLAVRLFANIMAGHTVLAAILGFIGTYASQGFLYFLITPSSIFGQIGIGMLELFVAFLQAYVFAFLSTLFIATAAHPH